MVARNAIFVLLVIKEKLDYFQYTINHVHIQTSIQKQAQLNVQLIFDNTFFMKLSEAFQILPILNFITKSYMCYASRGLWKY